MMDAYTLSVASIVSQATLAITLCLLAWSDRRTKGMVCLAAAALLQTAVASSLLYAPPLAGMVGALVSPLLVLQYFLFYKGLRWFAVRRSLRSHSGPTALVTAVGAILLAQRVSPQANFLLTECVLTVLIGITIRMLWTSRLRSLQVALRCCAVFLAVRGAFILLQMVRTAHSPIFHGTALDSDVRLGILAVMPLFLLSFLGLFVAETNRRLHEETRLDVLTGLRNRRALEEIAAREAHRCSAADIPLALLMMDLDHFKHLNDTWGHGLGDRALRTMGTTLLTVMGDSAVTARMGGEEFAVLLPGYEVDAATDAAERVRAAVEDLRLAEGERSATFTVSIGVSVMQAGERTWIDMMTRADDALYRAKREGRNRVCAAPTGSPAPRRERSQSAWKKHLLLPRRGPML